MPAHVCWFVVLVMGISVYIVYITIYCMALYDYCRDVCYSVGPSKGAYSGVALNLACSQNFFFYFFILFYFIFLCNYDIFVVLA